MVDTVVMFCKTDMKDRCPSPALCKKVGCRNASTPETAHTLPALFKGLDREYDIMFRSLLEMRALHPTYRDDELLMFIAIGLAKRAAASDIPHHPV